MTLRGGWWTGDVVDEWVLSVLWMGGVSLDLLHLRREFR